MSIFKLQSEFYPSGDQPKAIKKLVSSIEAGERHQTLLGVTGSGKTFTAANLIEKIGKPTLVIAHNKTLAAQLALEYREFFPDNSVHYFVSYYDYYQPEAYLPTTDTYIEKEAQINEEIERLRHASTQALLTRDDVIIVASVSCIYGLGSPEEYKKVNLKLSKGESFSRKELIMRLVGMYYERTNADLEPGLFRVVANTIEVMPPNEKVIYEISIADDHIETVREIDAITRAIVRDNPGGIFLFPSKHFVTNKEQQDRALKTISMELEEQLKKLERAGKMLEAERLKRRTRYDLALIREVGYCNGIENYSRHFSGKEPGEAPDTLLSYFPHDKDGRPDFLTVIDESHVTVPQIGGMYAGDASRKKNLIEHGFRLPSALDNRPLRFEEFEERVGQIVYTSATPGVYEKEHSSVVAEQIIRPTGLVDPIIEVVPVTEDKGHPGQIQHFISEAEKEIKRGNRVIATTLTKKMAEDLAEYLNERNLKTKYLHSEIHTIERIEILTDFRKGNFDCLVGVNLLREGLDLPELSFIGILDADKEGFLRSETSLIQTIGRAARNVDGRVILYADHITGSMKRAIEETDRRREKQLLYNKKHNITPKTIKKNIKDITDQMRSEHKKTVDEQLAIEMKQYGGNVKKLIQDKKKQMAEAVKILDFETAAIVRDELKELESTIQSSNK